MGDRIICDTFCRISRRYQVFGINEKCEEILIMTAKQEMLSCNSLGYMLVYKASNVILGALGYQKNPICCCCCPFCDCCCDCFCDCEDCGCINCNKCCKKGRCCKGGFCPEGGCCCFCEDGCCEEGCCDDCFCDCCCNEPCCEKGCCSCPNFERFLLDIRFLNTMEEALDIESGLYVSTLYEPLNCFGLCPSRIGYKKCGERFAIKDKCCPCNDISIIDLQKKENVGNIKGLCKYEPAYEVDFPKDALPLEKLLIISEIFMLVFCQRDNVGNNKMILTNKRKTLPGFKY